MAALTDANGWPVPDAVTAKMVTAVESGDISVASFSDTAPTLAAVISEFQAPAPIGTGRQFTPTVETRLFDGNGRAEIVVPDIMPGTSITVTCFGMVIGDAVLKTNYRGEGTTAIVRTGSGYGYPFDMNDMAMLSTFLQGNQNVAVTATWGANVPAAISDAVACEAARRVLVACVGGVTGAGMTIKDENTQISQGTGALNLRTSILLEWEGRYRSVVESYRDSGAWKRQALVRRMS